MLLNQVKWIFTKSKKEEPNKEETKNDKINQEPILARQLYHKFVLGF